MRLMPHHAVSTPLMLSRENSSHYAVSVSSTPSRYHATSRCLHVIRVTTLTRSRHIMLAPRDQCDYIHMFMPHHAHRMLAPAMNHVNSRGRHMIQSRNDKEEEITTVRTLAIDLRMKKIEEADLKLKAFHEPDLKINGMKRTTNIDKRGTSAKKREREVSQERSKETRKGETLTARVLRSLWKSARLHSGFKNGREEKEEAPFYKKKR
ncbi:hypothetical protein YC2023_108854 [Brassica napus]